MIFVAYNEKLADNRKVLISLTYTNIEANLMFGGI